MPSPSNPGVITKFVPSMAENDVCVLVMGAAAKLQVGHGRSEVGCAQGNTYTGVFTNTMRYYIRGTATGGACVWGGGSWSAAHAKSIDDGREVDGPTNTCTII